jgi:hypothetical protein
MGKQQVTRKEKQRRLPLKGRPSWPRCYTLPDDPAELERGVSVATQQEREKVFRERWGLVVGVRVAPVPVVEVPAVVRLRGAVL